jgi:MoaA/NifB/PqqE/SkfB family radical SAM enzyme
MNFAQNGDVTVCCYNREYVLGTYPRNTLGEIWHGPRAAELRAAMSDNALPPGCELCLSQLRSANFSGLGATRAESSCFSTRLCSQATLHY